MFIHSNIFFVINQLGKYADVYHFGCPGLKTALTLLNPCKPKMFVPHTAKLNVFNEGYTQRVVKSQYKFHVSILRESTVKTLLGPIAIFCFVLYMIDI